MCKSNDGGPVFPFEFADGPTDRLVHGGMSLRDYFAGQALHGLCASMIAHDNWDEIDRHKVAKYAYGFADAMLEERKL